MGGKFPKALGVILGMLLPLGALQMMATGAQASQNPDNPEKAQAAQFSPAWLGQKGTHYLTLASSDLLTKVNSQLKDATWGTNGQGGTSCSAYSENLYKAYERTTNAQNANATTGSVKLISQMWESGYLRNWSVAQFGDTPGTAYVYCHALETQGGIMGTERFAIAGGDSKVAGYWYTHCNDKTNECIIRGNGVQKGDATIQSGDYAGMSLNPFTTYIGAPIEGGGGAPYYAWAGCSEGGGKLPRGGWGGLTGESRLSADICKEWATKGAPGTEKTGDAAKPATTGTVGGQAAIQERVFGEGKSKVLNFGKPADLNGAVEAAATDEALKDPATRNGSEVRTMFMAYWGHNAPERFFNGLLALITAILYAWSLLGVAAGTIIAGFGFAIMLAILPFSLILAAFQKGQMSSNAGVKMLKLTAGLAGTAVVLQIVLALLVIFTTLIQAAGSAAGGGSFIGQSLITAMAPVIAFIILKIISTKMGFGNIMSPGGAVGMTTSAALKATGNDGASSKLSDSLQSSKDRSKMAKWKNPYGLNGGMPFDSEKKDANGNSIDTHRGLGAGMKEKSGQMWNNAKERTRNTKLGALAFMAAGSVGNALDKRKTNKEQAKIDANGTIPAGSPEIATVQNNAIEGNSNIHDGNDPKLKAEAAETKTVQNVTANPAAAQQVAAAAPDVVVNYVNAHAGSTPDGQVIKVLSEQQVHVDGKIRVDGEIKSSIRLPSIPANSMGGGRVDPATKNAWQHIIPKAVSKDVEKVVKKIMEEERRAL